MPALQQSVSHTFRRTTAAVAVDSDSDRSALRLIDDLVVQAHQAYHQRHYREAIALYRRAETEVVKHLHPAGSRLLVADAMIRSAELVEALIDVSAETLNGLTVAGPQPRPRPRAGVPADVAEELAKVTRLSGMDARSLDTPAARAAAADWRLARSYTEQGNTKAAEEYRASALRSDERTVSLLDHAFPAGNGLAAGPLADVLPFPLSADRAFTGHVGGVATSISWNAAENVRSVLRKSYADRRAAAILDVPAFATLADVAAELAHLFAYTIPLGLAESYRALADYANAEEHYRQVARYAYLNQAAEAPYVWQGLSGLYLDWGNALFRAGEVADAQDRYVRVVTPDGTPGVGDLYSAPGLTSATKQAQAVLAEFDRFRADPAKSCVDTGVDAGIAESILDIFAQLTKIKAGLDFYGHPATTVPIWTFDYLQSVAGQLAQQAVAAERDVINFWDQADKAKLTGAQLSQAVAQGDAEVDAVAAQVKAAEAQVKAYEAGATLAEKRAKDAHDNAEDYAVLSSSAITHQALSAQMSGGDNGDAAQLNRLADRMNSGPYSFTGSRGTLAAAEQLAAAKRNQAYELAAMGRTEEELNLAKTQADAETAAANAQVDAQNSALAAAKLRAAGARELRRIFADSTFTADVWKAMGDRMYALYRRYLTMALDTAHLAQRAYNFENDTSLHLIKLDYTGDEVRGLLAADVLLADIQSFTYASLTSGRGKEQPISHTVSLAALRAYEFETSFRRTGSLDFETRVEDFDEAYPGSFGGRVQAVEVEVLGIVPPRGLSGTLTNAGVSSYRLPADLWTDGTPGLRYRVQNVETLVLSDFDRRTDSGLFRLDTRHTGLFEGAGVASSWRLDLPKAVNDLDYGAITDVRVTFHYLARFDRQLRTRVLDKLATLPGNHQRQRGIPLRWLYPEAFFAIRQTGTTTFSLRQRDFPTSQTLPVIETIEVLLVTDSTLPAAGLGVRLATPGHATDLAVSGVDGVATWPGQTGGSALGEYTLGVCQADGTPADLRGLVNVALVFGYRFTPKA